MMSVTLTKLEYAYLLELTRGMAKAPCRKSNCGTVCLCLACCARRILPTVEKR